MNNKVIFLKTIIIFLIFVIFCGSIIFIPGTELVAQSLEDELEDVKKEREETKKKIEEVKKEEQSYIKQVNEVETQLVASLSELGALNDRLAEAKSYIDKINDYNQVKRFIIPAIHLKRIKQVKLV